MNSPKVLHLVLKGDGLTQVVAEDINIGMVEGGCQVTMVYMRDRDGALPKTFASNAVGLGLDSHSRIFFDWLAFRGLSGLLSATKFDVVISHRYKPCILAMKLARKFPDVKFVNVVHGTGHYDRTSRKRAITRLAHERCGFVCVSEAVADFIRTRCGINETASPVEVIPNGIDIGELDAQQLSRGEARRELGLDSESLWIGFAGRLVRIKGVIELVEGFAEIAGSSSPLKLAILGKGEFHGELQALIESKGLQDRVFLLGQIPQARRFFKAFDAFVLPSYREGMSIALLEAMATGLPLLVSDIPMNRELVDENTILFPPKSSESVAAALKSFLQMGEGARIAHGAVNRKLVEEKYDIRLFRRNYAGLVNRLVNRGA